MKKLLVFVCALIVFLGGCSPSQPADMPTQTPAALAQTLTPTASPDPKWTSTPAPASPTSPATPTIEATPVPTLQPNIQEAQLQSISMKDELSGWAWAMDDAYVHYLLHTSDGGLTWKDVTPDESMGLAYFLAGQSAWAAILDPASRHSVTLLHTTDGGNTWTIVNREMQKVDLDPYSSSYAFEDEKNGWWKTATIGAGTAHIYSFRTSDGGVTWEQIVVNVPQALWENYYIRGDEYGEVAICNICGSFLYLDLSRIIFSPGEWSPATFFLTTDWGTTWNKTELAGLPDDINPDSSPIRYPTFFNEREGVLSVFINDPAAETWQIFIYGTQDGGLTWNLEGEPIFVDRKSEGGAQTMFVSRLDGFLSTNKTLFVTHDGGKTWSQTALPEDFVNTDTVHTESQFNFIDPTTGWALLKKFPQSGGKVLATIFLSTIDGGLTWNEIVPVINP